MKSSDILKKVEIRRNYYLLIVGDKLIIGERM